MGDLIVPSVHDDLSDVNNLNQARMIAALDDEPVLPPGPPRIAVVVDATSSMGEYLPSREVTLEKARSDLRVMFEAVPDLQVLILYFRGTDEFGNLVGWFTDPEAAAQAIAGIEHKPGFTQHDKVFKYLIEEIGKQPIHAVVFFTDAVELRGPGNPNGDDWVELCKDAMRLRRLGCRVAFAYKGTIPNGCPIDRAGPHAEQRIRELAADNVGVVLKVTDPKFADKLRTVTTEAALRAKGDSSSVQELLPDLRAVPFDLVAVGDEVPVGRCGAPGSAGSNEPRTG
jgi:hypothetical protein